MNTGNGDTLEILRDGLRCHEEGRLEEAARIYTAVLQRDVGSSDGWHLMGRLLLGRGQFGAAASAVAEAIRLRPDLPAFHATLGDILAAQGRLREALLCYEQAVRCDPRFTPALVNFGNVLQSQGRFGEALAVCVRAIETDGGCAEAFNNAGNALLGLGRNGEAAECFREALRLKPASPETCVNLSALYLREHRAEDAEKWARRALALRPQLSAALRHLSLALLARGRLEEAERFAREALAQEPRTASLHSNLSSVLIQQKRWEEAESACRRAFELQPGCPEAVLNFGAILEARGQYAEAEAQYRIVLQVQPGYADAWANLVTTLQAQGRDEEALAAVETALALAPAHAKAHFCRSLLWLREGRLEEGFVEYEWRWKTMRDVPRAAARPEWDGEPLEGRTILVHAEQGLGDTIQFARYLPRVAAKGGRLLVECQPGMVPLLRDFAGVAGVLTAEDALPEFDVQAPLMSLPRIFRTGLDAISAEVPYLAYDRRTAEELKKKMGPRRGLRVGLAWSGNPLNGGDPRRSIPVEMLRPLREIEGVEYYSLHIGGKARRQVEACGGWMSELLSKDGGLPELAALIAVLDLVITVDSMPAHLAGALARPVWNLLCHAPDWRWLTGREDSPWYPTMRLFRQPGPGDWETVVGRVVTELAHISVQDLPREADTEN